LKHKISQDLGLLLDGCEAINRKRSSSGPNSKRPNEPVHKGIAQTLSEFAKLTRYYNLDLLSGGKAAKLPEPVGTWWKRVGELILLQHYKKDQREKNQAMADDLDKLAQGRVSVRHYSGTGESINDVSGVVRRAGATRVVQKYGRLYVLQIVRWLSYLISELAYEAAYTHRIGSFVGLEEPFKYFLNDDHYFRTRKTWAIYP
jgi:hypothetical protein